MKKVYLYGGIAASLVMAACSNDDMPLPADSDNVATIDRTLFVSMSIAGDDATRASASTGSPDDNDTDFKEGVGENDINNAYFVFYDKDGMVVGDIVPVDLNSEHLVTNVNGGTVEKAYQSVVPVSVRKGEKLPTRVICYINPISPSTLQVPLSTIQTVTRQQTNTSQGGNTFFAMSNSVYYPDETDAESTPRIAVDVPETALFPTEAKAQEAFTDDALKDNIVTIHVERYASKLEFSAGPVSEYKTGTRIYNATAYDNKEVTLEFIPEYWALNAEATDTYVIKSFREQSTDGQVLPANYTYGRLDRYINITDPENYDAGGTLPNATKWDWNNPDYHRSYWAMSPAYFQDEYPEVSADLKDIDDIKQKYIAYNELDKLGFKASDTNPHYFLETTVGSMALSTTNPAAAVASVIYVGKYKLSLGGTPLADNTPFYTYLSGKVNGIEEERPYIYFDNKLNSAESAVDGGESMLRRFFAQTTILYKKVTEEDGSESFTRLNFRDPDDLATLTAALGVSEISDDVKKLADGQLNTTLKLKANTRSLQFRNSATTADNHIYIVTQNGYNEIVANNATPGNNQITVNQANAVLMRQVGYSYYYNLGHAYFNIPVKHLGWYRQGNENKASDELDWSKVRVGDFGMVRNHQYKITVSKVEGLAEGISGDDVPIVPPITPSKYFVAYSVRILKWAVVPEQKVDL